MPQGPVKVRDGLVYIGGGNGLAIFDATDPTDPKQLCKVKTGVETKTGSSIDLVGDLLFFAGGKGLAIFDVSDPVTPQHLSTLESGVEFYLSGSSVVIVGNYAYLCGGDGLAVIDVTDPEKPDKIKVVKTGVLTATVGGHVDAVGNKLFIVGGKGLAIFDISQRANPKRISKRKTGVIGFNSSTPPFIKVVGRTAYVVGNDGLATFDTDDPAKPVRKFKVKVGVHLGIDPTCVDVQGEYIYVMGQRGWAIYWDHQKDWLPECIYLKVSTIFQELNISEYLTMSTNQQFDETGRASCNAMITVKGSLAYILGWDSLAIHDIADLKQPNRLSKTTHQLFGVSNGEEDFAVTEVKAEYAE